VADEELPKSEMPDVSDQSGAIVGTAAVTAGVIIAQDSIEEVAENASSETDVANVDLPEADSKADAQKATIVELVPDVIDVEKSDDIQEVKNVADNKSNAADDDNEKADTSSEPTLTVFPLKHRPDDPGVEDDQAKEADRFKLF
jgi:uncharacterized membrane-anchored protein